MMASRKSDERLLEWLRLRCEGVSAVSIAKHHGVNYQMVSNATNAVMKADIEVSGDEVRSAYW